MNVTSITCGIVTCFFLQARGYLQSLPYKPKLPWERLYPKYADSSGNL